MPKSQKSLRDEFGARPACPSVITPGYGFRQLEGVAQASSLLYRGFPICRCDQADTACRLEVGDTAGWKSALRNLGSLVPLVGSWNMRVRLGAGPLPPLVRGRAPERVQPAFHGCHVAPRPLARRRAAGRAPGWGRVSEWVPERGRAPGWAWAPEWARALEWARAPGLARARRWRRAPAPAVERPARAPGPAL